MNVWHAPMIRTAALVAMLGCLCPAAPTAAQGTTADIVGIVVDSSGSVLPGATATATNRATRAVHTAVTDESGTYGLLLLPVGTYTVTVELQGFKKSTTEVTLAVGDRFLFDSRLEVGGVEESVNVVAESPLLQTQTSTLGTLTDARSMQDLPLNGRNFIRLAQIAPGDLRGSPRGAEQRHRPDDRRQSSALSVNGGDPSNNNFLIDGIDNNERFIGTVIVRPNVDAIHEMKLDSNNFSADQGRSAGGVVNILTKSGTNDIHGSLYGFYRNEALDANDFFARGQARLRPEAVRRQFRRPARGQSHVLLRRLRGAAGRQGADVHQHRPDRRDAGRGLLGRGGHLRPADGQRFPGDVIPGNRIDPAAANILKLVPLPQTGAAVNNYVCTPVEDAGRRQLRRSGRPSIQRQRFAVRPLLVQQHDDSRARSLSSCQWHLGRRRR